MIVDVNDLLKDKDKYVTEEELKITGKAPKNCFELLYHFNFSVVDVSELDVSDMKDAVCFFDGCQKLEEVKGLDKWNTENLENANCFFCGCENLKEVKGLNNWNTKNLVNADFFFCDCESLEKIDLSSWNTENLKKPCYMFNGCSNLTNIKGLDNLKIDLTDEKQIHSMFDKSPMLEKIEEIIKKPFKNFSIDKNIDL